MKKPKPMQPLVRDTAAARKAREHKLLASVGFRKVSVDDVEKEKRKRELERQADEILLKAIAENVQTLCEGFAELRLPSQDPEYLKKLQVNEAERNAISNKINQIDIVPDGLKSYVGVGSFNHGEAKELSLLLASHFEVTKIRQHE